MAQLFQYYKSFQNAKSNNTAPTFEDLTIDDNLSELDRVVRYCRSTIGLQRLVHVKMLGSVASTVGYEITHAQIVPVLESLAVDFEPAIRCHLCEQITIISKFCIEHGGESGYQAVLENVLPVIALLLEDDKVDVRQAASASLVAVSHLVRSSDLGQYVLTIILQLAHEDDSEDMRMTASELLNLLAELLGFDLCKQFVIPEVVSLAEDPVFRVRKSTALNFQNVCKIGGEYELFERLMPAFVRLSKDDMYRVRRACAESLCEISKHVSDDIRVGVLVEIFLRLAQDPSKHVKQSVLQQSGMFISTLPKRVISKAILEHYCNMVNNPTGDVAVDAELRRYCAFSFPGVLQTVGVERWSDLRQVYHTLVQSQNPHVKQTLAMSLHEIAKILGMKLAEEELVAVFEEMVQNSETVKMGVIKYLAEFLQLLSMPCRVSYLPLLDDILLAASPFNWRLRQSLASQLSDLVQLPPPQNVYGTLFPLAMTLVRDPVAEVRKESFRGVAKMLRVLEPGYVAVYRTENGTESTQPLSDEEGTQYLNNVARAINALVHGETYHQRQLWAKLSLELLKGVPREMFERYFVGGILLLTSDSVANVRVSVSEMLTGWAPDYPAPWVVEDSSSCPWKWLLERGDIQECVERLSKDDKDVVLNMSKVEPLFPNITFENMKCVGLKRAPGGVVPVGKELMKTLQNKEDGLGGSNDSSSDSSVGGGLRSSSSSITSSQGGATPHDECYDEFASDDSSSLPSLCTSSPGKVPHRTTHLPNTGRILTSEDILVDEVDFMDKSNEAMGLPVQAAVAIPSPLELHIGHVLSDDEEEFMALQESAAVSQYALESPKTIGGAPLDETDVILDLTAPASSAESSTSEMTVIDNDVNGDCSDVGTSTHVAEDSPVAYGQVDSLITPTCCQTRAAANDLRDVCSEMINSPDQEDPAALQVGDSSSREEAEESVNEAN